MVDWWTLGILIYELRIGRPPFLDKNHQKLGRMIKKGKIIFPDPIRHKIDMSEELKDIIMQLLDREPSKRLGNKGYQQIMNHPWFKDVDFDSILKKEMKAPFKPNLKSKVKNPNAYEYGRQHTNFHLFTLNSHVSYILSKFNLQLNIGAPEELRSTETIIEGKSRGLITENNDKFAEF